MSELADFPWASKVVVANDVILCNQRPITFIAGLNVLEEPSIVFDVAHALLDVCQRESVPLIFKASFDKANRSSINSYRGPGLERGLSLLQSVKDRFHVPIVTDIHEPWQAKPAADVADVIQIPAFLSRQTDLLEAAADVDKPILVKKMQMMAPAEVRNVLSKCSGLGANQILITERGTSFGYHNLVVDPLSFPILKSFNVPVVFDVTHAVQTPGAQGESTGGRGQFVEDLSVMAAAAGIAALFIECHPVPSKARCDGPCAWPLHDFRRLVQKVCAVDKLVKGWVT